MDDDLFNNTNAAVPAFLVEENILTNNGNDTSIETNGLEKELPSETKPAKSLTSLNSSGRQVRESLSTIHGLKFPCLIFRMHGRCQKRTGCDYIKMKDACPESGDLIMEKQETKKTSVLAPLPARKQCKQLDSNDEGKE